MKSSLLAILATLIAASLSEATAEPIPLADLPAWEAKCVGGNVRITCPNCRWFYRRADASAKWVRLPKKYNPQFRLTATSSLAHLRFDEGKIVFPVGKPYVPFATYIPRMSVGTRVQRLDRRLYGFHQTLDCGPAKKSGDRTLVTCNVSQFAARTIGLAIYYGQNIAPAGGIAFVFRTGRVTRSQWVLSYFSRSGRPDSSRSAFIRAATACGMK